VRQVLYVGIIDFLQDWTCTKNLAMAVKVCERNKATVPPDEYGARFIRVNDETNRFEEWSRVWWQETRVWWMKELNNCFLT
jgi:hypothetical protein